MASPTALQPACSANEKCFSCVHVTGFACGDGELVRVGVAIARIFFIAALGYAGKASGTVTDSTKTGLGVLCTKYALPGALFKFMGSLNLTYIEPGVIGAVVIAKIVAFALAFGLGWYLRAGKRNGRPLAAGAIFGLAMTMSSDVAFAPQYMFELFPDVGAQIYLFFAASVLIFLPITLFMLEFDRARMSSGNGSGPVTTTTTAAATTTTTTPAAEVAEAAAVPASSAGGEGDQAAGLQQGLLSTAELRACARVAVQGVAMNPVMLASVAGLVYNVALGSLEQDSFLYTTAAVAADAFAWPALFLLGVGAHGKLSLLRGRTALHVSLMALVKVVLTPVLATQLLQGFGVPPLPNGGGSSGESGGWNAMVFIYGAVPPASTVGVFAMIYDIEIVNMAVLMPVSYVTASAVTLAAVAIIVQPPDVSDSVLDFHRGGGVALIIMGACLLVPRVWASVVDACRARDRGVVRSDKQGRNVMQSSYRGHWPSSLSAPTFWISVISALCMALGAQLTRACHHAVGRRSVGSDSVAWRTQQSLWVALRQAIVAFLAEVTIVAWRRGSAAADAQASSGALFRPLGRGRWLLLTSVALVPLLFVMVPDAVGGAQEANALHLGALHSIAASFAHRCVLIGADKSAQYAELTLCVITTLVILCLIKILEAAHRRQPVPTDLDKAARTGMGALCVRRHTELSELHPAGSADDSDTRTSHGSIHGSNPGAGAGFEAPVGAAHSGTTNAGADTDSSTRTSTSVGDMPGSSFTPPSNHHRPPTRPMSDKFKVQLAATTVVVVNILFVWELALVFENDRLSESSAAVMILLEAMALIATVMVIWLCYMFCGASAQFFGGILSEVYRCYAKSLGVGIENDSDTRRRAASISYCA